MRLSVYRLRRTWGRFSYDDCLKGEGIGIQTCVFVCQHEGGFDIDWRLDIFPLRIPRSNGAVKVIQVYWVVPIVYHGERFFGQMDIESGERYR